jgi:hypothetical protein
VNLAYRPSIQVDEPSEIGTSVVGHDAWMQINTVDHVAKERLTASAADIITHQFVGEVPASAVHVDVVSVSGMPATASTSTPALTLDYACRDTEELSNQPDRAFVSEHEQKRDVSRAGSAVSRAGSARAHGDGGTGRGHGHGQQSGTHRGASTSSETVTQARSAQCDDKSGADSGDGDGVVGDAPWPCSDNSAHASSVTTAF